MDSYALSRIIFSRHMSPLVLMDRGCYSSLDAANMFITSHRRVTGLAYCGFTFTARRGATLARNLLSPCPSVRHKPVL